MIANDKLLKQLSMQEKEGAIPEFVPPPPPSLTVTSEEDYLQPTSSYETESIYIDMKKSAKDDNSNVMEDVPVKLENKLPKKQRMITRKTRAGAMLALEKLVSKDKPAERYALGDIITEG